VIGKPLFDQQHYYGAFMKTAQYLASLTIQQNVWDQLGMIMVNFFRVDLTALVERRSDGQVVTHHWCIADGIHFKKTLTDEVRNIVNQVLDNGFLASELIHEPAPYVIVFLPITERNMTTAVMLVGHRMSEPLPKELLNIYLAVASLAGAAITRLTTAEKLKKNWPNASMRKKS